jgi:hypothetical protein
MEHATKLVRPAPSDETAPGRAAAIVDSTPHGTALRAIATRMQSTPRQQNLSAMARSLHAGPVVQRVESFSDADRDPEHEPERMGADLTNLVYRTHYRPDAQARLGAATGYFKPKTPAGFVGSMPVAYDDQLIGYTLASSQLSERLGLGVLARESLARHTIDGQELTGTVSTAVPNAAPMRQDGRARAIDLAHPHTQKGLSDLQLLDALTGQQDRRGENIFAGDDGTVTGIDQEASFGYGVRHAEGEREFMEEPDLRAGSLKKYLGLPSQVDARTAKIFLNLTPEALIDHLRIDGPHTLDEGDKQRAVARLLRVQKHLHGLRANNRLVTEWNNDTYRAAINEQMLLSRGGDVVPRSYIARHALEQHVEGGSVGPLGGPLMAPPPPIESMASSSSHEVVEPEPLAGPLVAPRVPPPTAGAFLSHSLGVPIDQNRTHAIPQRIHRFWTGGKLSPAAFEVLLESGAKTGGTGFTNHLWHSEAIEAEMTHAGLVSGEDVAERTRQRAILSASGYSIRSIESLAEADPAPLSFWQRMNGEQPRARTRGRLTQSDMRTMAGNAVTHLTAERAADQQRITGGADPAHVARTSTKYDGIKHFADMARLMYLHQQGGHHFDVDMGLGDMDLHRSYYHNDAHGNVPLLGALTALPVPEVANPLNILGRAEGRDLADPHTAAAGTTIAGRAHEMARALNGMIASRPGTANLTEAIEQLRHEAVGSEGAMATGMMVNPTLVLGPGHHGLGVAEKQRNYAQTVPPYLFDLQHLTADSENR